MQQILLKKLKYCALKEDNLIDVRALNSVNSLTLSRSNAEHIYNKCF